MEISNIQIVGNKFQIIINDPINEVEYPVLVEQGEFFELLALAYNVAPAQDNNENLDFVDG